MYKTTMSLFFRPANCLLVFLHLLMLSTAVIAGPACKDCGCYMIKKQGGGYTCQQCSDMRQERQTRRQCSEDLHQQLPSDRSEKCIICLRSFTNAHRRKQNDAVFYKQKIALPCCRAKVCDECLPNLAPSENSNQCPHCRAVLCYNVNCPLLGCPYSSQANIPQHILEKHRKMTVPPADPNEYCDACDSAFPYSQDQQWCLCENSKPVFRCQLCAKKYPSKDAYQKHLKLYHCPFCKHVFNSDEEFSVHLFSSHCSYNCPYAHCNQEVPVTEISTTDHPHLQITNPIFFPQPDIDHTEADSGLLESPTDSENHDGSEDELMLPEDVEMELSQLYLQNILSTSESRAEQYCRLCNFGTREGLDVLIEHYKAIHGCW